MLLKRLLQLNLVVCSLIAILFVLLPGTTLAFYGIGNDASTRAVAQYLGTGHVAFAVLVWIALRSNARQLLRAVIVSFFAGEVSGTLVLLIIQLRALMNPLGWGLVGLSLLFALGYGYCTFANLPKPE